AFGTRPAGPSPGANPRGRGRIRTDVNGGAQATRASEATAGWDSFALDHSSLWIALTPRSPPRPRGSAARAEGRGDCPRALCPLSGGRGAPARACQGLAPAQAPV